VKQTSVCRYICLLVHFRFGGAAPRQASYSGLKVATQPRTSLVDRTEQGGKTPFQGLASTKQIYRMNISYACTYALFSFCRSC
jgi:hypothetical protein